MKITALKNPFVVERHFALLQKINPVVGVDCLAELINRDQVALYEVHADNDFLGVFISRVDTLLNGERELVIMHASAVVQPPLPLTRYLDPLFDQVARDHGLKFIRVHSDKKGLDRILEDHKYNFQEAVYRKAL